MHSYFSNELLSLPALGIFLREFETLLRGAELCIFALYYTSLAALSLYALHRLHLLFLLRTTQVPAYGEALAWDKLATGAGSPELQLNPTAPSVTVQLPIFNERSVATRLINAVANLDYPAHLLQIQVLDDSTDQTSSVIARSVAQWQKQGLSVQHLRRSQRTGYKAGALAAALPSATGRLIAIFDADFVPPRDFLLKTVPHFEDQAVGMVQGRWDHLNEKTSLLTRVQALLLDAHFLIEHAARARSRRLFNFNGTAGVWRREAIEEAGGWQHDTLTEDLDLSYRSQLAGWQFRFLADLGVPAELPNNLAAYRGQQRRWTLGSAQTLRKLAGRLLTSTLTVRQKVEALAHLSANLGYPLTVLVAILLPLVVYLRHLGAEPGLLWFDLALLLCGTFAVFAFYLEAARRRGRSLAYTLLLMPVLLALCMGLSWHNAKAAITGLFKVGGEFERTPKSGASAAKFASTSASTSIGKTPALYRARRRFPWGESLLALYLGCAALLLAASGALIGLPFLLLFLCGFSSSAAMLWRSRPRSGAASTAAEPAIASTAEGP